MLDFGVEFLRCVSAITHTITRLVVTHQASAWLESSSLTFNGNTIDIENAFLSCESYVNKKGDTVNNPVLVVTACEVLE